MRVIGAAQGAAIATAINVDNMLVHVCLELGRARQGARLCAPGDATRRDGSEAVARAIYQPREGAAHRRAPRTRARSGHRDGDGGLHALQNAIELNQAAFGETARFEALAAEYMMMDASSAEGVSAGGGGGEAGGAPARRRRRRRRRGGGGGGGVVGGGGGRLGGRGAGGGEGGAEAAEAREAAAAAARRRRRGRRRWRRRRRRRRQRRAPASVGAATLRPSRGGGACGPAVCSPARRRRRRCLRRRHATRPPTAAGLALLGADDAGSVQRASRAGIGADAVGFLHLVRDPGTPRAHRGRLCGVGSASAGSARRSRRAATRW